MVVNGVANAGTRVRFPSPAPKKMLLTIFKKMRESIHRKIEADEPGLYISIAFPILFAFIITFSASRIFSHLFPQFYLPIAPGLHIHHFTYGMFILAASGYLALIIKDPRAKYWTALLHGFGLGLAMDEFGMWLRLRDDNIVRWSYDGFNITIGIFLLILTVKPGFRLIKKLWPNKKPLF